MSQARYKRALVKVSGEALLGQGNSVIEAATLGAVARQIKAVREKGVEVAVVVGGGNIWRGAAAAALGMDRVAADYAGMLATLINALALRDALEKEKVPVCLQSAFGAGAAAEPIDRWRAREYLGRGYVVLFAGGTGNPYVTTDTAAALRAAEIGAEVLLMGKNQVDGVYEADPQKRPQAKKFSHLTYAEALARNLEVMDSIAFALCRQNHIPIMVFDLQAPHCLERAIAGEPIGTLISDASPGS